MNGTWWGHALMWALVYIPLGSIIWGRGRVRNVGIVVMLLGLANLAYVIITTQQTVTTFYP